MSNQKITLKYKNHCLVLYCEQCQTRTHITGYDTRYFWCIELKKDKAFEILNTEFLRSSLRGSLFFNPMVYIDDDNCFIAWFCAECLSSFIGITDKIEEKQFLLKNIIKTVASLVHLGGEEVIQKYLTEINKSLFVNENQ